ncbi:hypothetical protein BpHYR1_009531 [Brachionus plicatilis]|uniref:Uncharacterized protein n=1 Tax=Brachionus plicatilis TaxID=10195 RepID=A0A3M7STT9_BRAPC|nr:hypothetical protein BpHYR1_009531 [Brachionus plicatilis]
MNKYDYCYLNGIHFDKRRMKNALFVISEIQVGFSINRIYKSKNIIKNEAKMSSIKQTVYCVYLADGRYLLYQVLSSGIITNLNSRERINVVLVYRRSFILFISIVLEKNLRETI